ncbi:MAG: hypothetical protein HDR43_01085 [Mycoplasma sp.]|nr:hypothetical protein [Mycoplasma sp.]
MLNLNKAITNPGISDPLILSGVVLMALAIMIPCLIWFIRNIFRIILKKDYWWLTSSVKLSWIIGCAIFVIGICLLVIKLINP